MPVYSMGHVNKSNKASLVYINDTKLRPNPFNSRLLVQARASLHFKFLGQTHKPFFFFPVTGPR